MTLLMGLGEAENNITLAELEVGAVPHAEPCRWMSRN